MDTHIILIIEDNPLNMKLFRVLLKSEKYEVIEAEDAKTGIDQVRLRHPHLILMDIGLPGMDGLSATRIIKADPALKNIPIVALTSHAMSGDEEKTLEAGCDGYMSKPINTQCFLEMVSRHLSGRVNRISELSSSGKEKEGLDGGTCNGSEQNDTDC
jgi:CheY-like chemotaxis protein